MQSAAKLRSIRIAGAGLVLLAVIAGQKLLRADFHNASQISGEPVSFIAQRDAADETTNIAFGEVNLRSLTMLRISTN